MSTADTRAPPAREPRPIIPPLASFYAWSRDISYLIIRVTAGGMVLQHGLTKLINNSVANFAANSMASRGIHPALPAAYAVFTLETVGAACVILGLFTRFWAAALAIEFAVITFVAHWPNGFGWTSPRGGWEFPLFWGLIFFAIALRGGGPYSLDRKLGWEL
jgi:putative oxidoreductase